MQQGDGDTNECDWAEHQVEPARFTEALAEVRNGGSWREGPIRLDGTTLSVGTRSMYAPGPATARLGRERMDLLLLDSYEAAFSSGIGARTGDLLPARSIDTAFLETLRRHPQKLRDLTTIGFDRVVLGLLNEVSGATVTLEPLGEDEPGLWIARTSGDERGAMLIAVQHRDRDIVSIDVVDRINGVRDRSQVSKAVIVTRSSFTADVTAEYAAFSQRMELLDFDRLVGILADEGWLSSTPGFMLAPVQERPRHRIFISYSWEQRGIAVELYNRLHGWQYSCFLDSVDLVPDDSILTSVERALAGTDAVLLLCSKAALSSPWVQAEIGLCLKREKESGRTILIPLRVDNTRFKAPYAELNGRLAADLTRWQSTARKASALEKIRAALDRTVQQA
jgi:TIR domain/Restriction endonuclease